MIPLNSIRKIAWNFQKQNPTINWEDLFQEAAIAFLESQKTYDSEKGTKPITWAWIQMKHQLQNHTNNEYEQQKLKNYPTQPETASPSFFKEENLGRLSREAQQVCQLILIFPSEYAKMVPKQARGKIVQVLRQQGWKWKVIWNVFRELKIAFS
jgi:DNA-directed RNA polymerase specialized sigma subunit